MLEQLDKRNRGEMLGGLIKELRKRVGLASEFDALLSEFRKDRKTLVHDLVWRDFSTPEGLAEIKGFALGASAKAERIMKIFVALIEVWTEQRGWKEELRSLNPELYDLEFFAELRRTLIPRLPDLIFNKSNEPSNIPGGITMQNEPLRRPSE